MSKPQHLAILELDFRLHPRMHCRSVFKDGYKLGQTVTAGGVTRSSAHTDTDVILRFEHANLHAGDVFSTAAIPHRR
jgi:hypothetical protein